MLVYKNLNVPSREGTHLKILFQAIGAAAMMTGGYLQEAVLGLLDETHGALDEV